MHYLHVLAVEAETADDAVAQAEAFLASYQDQVWDWYEVGGRWDGYLAGSNTLQASVDAALFLSVVDDLEAARWASMRELRRHLVGPDGNHETWVGQVEPGSEVAERLDAGYRCDAALYGEIMTAERFDRGEYEMVGYRMAKLGRLLAGYFEVDSLVYDAAWGTGSLGAVRQRVLDDPERQWLVVADLHM